MTMTIADVDLEAVVEPPRRRFRVLRSIARKPTGRAAVAVLLLIVVAALAAPLLDPNDPTSQDLARASRPPIFAGGSPALPLGTDGFGRDLLARLLYGARTSLFIGLVAATCSAALGSLLGLVAGYYHRTVGPVLMRVAEVQFALPATFVALAVIAIYGGGLKNLLILLSVIGWATYARTISVSVAQAAQMDYVKAIRLQGGSTPRLLFRHILPNVLGPVIVFWSTSAGALILAESGLSFIGLGVQEPQFSWGSMLAEAQMRLRTAWWEALFPGLALTFTVTSFNLLGDALRDALNVRLSDR